MHIYYKAWDIQPTLICFETTLVNDLKILGQDSQTMFSHLLNPL